MPKIKYEKEEKEDSKVFFFSVAIIALLTVIICIGFCKVGIKIGETRALDLETVMSESQEELKQIKENMLEINENLLEVKSSLKNLKNKVENLPQSISQTTTNNSVDGNEADTRTDALDGTQSSTDINDNNNE